ncbi:MAG: hypothetical protein ACLTMH_17665 [Faecalimonas umbilicata]|uniref:hypothetical protein n=1 Tax=Faecalimonas umbilicata TaxID=1912855 RepID=UPI0039950CDA
MKSMTRLTNLEMNLDGDLELIDAEGTATTALPAELFQNQSGDSLLSRIYRDWRRSF